MSKNARATKRTTRTLPKRRGQPKAQDDPPEVAPGHPDAHVSRPVRDCRCLQCRYHRAAWRQQERDRLIAKAWDERHALAPLGQVLVGTNATDVLRSIMTGSF